MVAAMTTTDHSTVRGERATPTEHELAKSLAGIVATAKAVKDPALRKAASEGMLDLAGLVLALLRRVSALERRAVPKYLGVWRANSSYSEGALVTENGSLWHCNKETDSKPGTNADWTLCVKRGRDGKDGR
jgi:hypothetical protein